MLRAGRRPEEGVPGGDGLARKQVCTGRRRRMKGRSGRPWEAQEGRGLVSSSLTPPTAAQAGVSETPAVYQHPALTSWAPACPLLLASLHLQGIHD